MDVDRWFGIQDPNMTSWIQWQFDSCFKEGPVGKKDRVNMVVWKKLLLQEAWND